MFRRSGVRFADKSMRKRKRIESLFRSEEAEQA
jgi:hypothetical protein